VYWHTGRLLPATLPSRSLKPLIITVGFSLLLCKGGRKSLQDSNQGVLLDVQRCGVFCRRLQWVDRRCTGSGTAQAAISNTRRSRLIGLLLLSCLLCGTSLLDCSWAAAGHCSSSDTAAVLFGLSAAHPEAGHARIRHKRANSSTDIAFAGLAGIAAELMFSNTNSQ
jgi:hypothetical protein